MLVRCVVVPGEVAVLVVVLLLAFATLLVLVCVLEFAVLVVVLLLAITTLLVLVCILEFAVLVVVLVLAITTLLVLVCVLEFAALVVVLVLAITTLLVLVRVLEVAVLVVVLPATILLVLARGDRRRHVLSSRPSGACGIGLCSLISGRRLVQTHGTGRGVSRTLFLADVLLKVAPPIAPSRAPAPPIPSAASRVSTTPITAAAPVLVAFVCSDSDILALFPSGLV